MVTPIPPFHFLPTPTRNKLMKVAIVLALTMTAVMTIMGRPLTTAAAPSGIVSFEFAGSIENAQAMLNSWDAHTKLIAALSLGLDFLYPLVYASAISLACVWAVERVRPSKPSVANAGVWLVWGVWVAAACDYIENISLVMILLGSTANFWPVIAFVCAAIKFALIIGGIFYVLAGWLLFPARKPAKK